MAEKFEKNKLSNSVNNADAIGVSLTGFNLKESIDICKLIKEIDKNIPLIVDGPHVSLYPEKTLKESNAGIAVKGEGEPGINKLVEFLQGKNSLKMSMEYII